MPIMGYNIAVAIIAIMVSIGGIILGMGYALDDKKLKEFGRSEVYNSVINGVILGSLVLAFSPSGIITAAINGISGSVVSGYTCPSQMAYNSAICFSYNYLVGIHPITVYNASYPTLIDSALIMMVPVSALYAGLSVLGSINLNLGLLSFGLASSLKPLLTPLGYCIDLLSASIIGIEAQGALLRFISVTAIPVLLPIGIVLRTLYFTRRLGGAIMAVAIGLFAVFPMTYILDATMVNAYSTSFSAANVSSALSGAQSLQSGIMGQISNYGKAKGPTSTGIFSYITDGVSVLVNGFGQVLQGLESYIAVLIVEVFLIPAFSVILTAVSIRELAKLLGTEINFGRFYWI